MRKNLKDAKGSSAIPVTPFKEDGSIDISVLEKEIEFLCASKVGSICVPVNVSEFMVLSEEERRLMIEVPVKVAAGRTAIIANVAAVNISTAVKYTEFAENIGADAVIAMPPYVGELDFAGAKQYYSAISEATSLPVMVQNMPFTNISLSVDNVVELCEMKENITWVKQEVLPAPVAVEQLAAKHSTGIEGIMSGFSGLYSPQDYENGAIATIHACEYCDVMQKIWDLMDEGKMSEARALHARLTPALLLEGVYGLQYDKYILVKRGICKNYNVRNKCRPLSEGAIKEADAAYEMLQDLL